MTGGIVLAEAGSVPKVQALVKGAMFVGYILDLPKHNFLQKKISHLVKFDG